MIKRGVLAHQAYVILLFRKIIFYPGKEAFRVFLLAGQHHMTDNDALFYKEASSFWSGIFFKHRRACLVDHGGDGFPGIFKVIGRSGLLQGNLRAEIFEIGKKNIYITIQGPDRFRTLIAAAVVDDRDQELLPDQIESAHNGRKILGCSNQVNIMGAVVLKAEKDISQLPDGELLSEIFTADPVVLAETASQGTAAEKYGSAAI